MESGAETDRFTGRSIPDPGFADDDGVAPAAVTAALAAHGRGEVGARATLAALLDHRLLVPVVAVLGEVELDERGLAHDKSSDMATVLLTGRDGRQALLAFTGVEQMHRWNPEARPVPAGLPLAARSALQDGAAALVIDVAGPVPFAIEGDDLAALARGLRLAEVAGTLAWIGTAGE